MNLIMEDSFRFNLCIQCNNSVVCELPGHDVARAHAIHRVILVRILSPAHPPLDVATSSATRHGYLPLPAQELVPTLVCCLVIFFEKSAELKGVDENIRVTLEDPSRCWTEGVDPVKHTQDFEGEIVICIQETKLYNVMVLVALFF